LAWLYIEANNFLDQNHFYIGTQSLIIIYLMYSDFMKDQIESSYFWLL